VSIWDAAGGPWVARNRAMGRTRAGLSSESVLYWQWQNTRHSIMRPASIEAGSSGITRMSRVVIQNPILNSPFREPTRHFHFDEKGITDLVIEAGARAITSCGLTFLKLRQCW
jgi:hypothetical protein